MIAYITYNKNLGCRELTFRSEEYSYLAIVRVEKTNEPINNQYNGGIMVGDVVYCFEDGNNYKILKIN